MMLIIFLIDFKGDKSRNESSTGLGLYVVKSLVDKLGGSVCASLNEQKFKVEIRLNIV